MTPASLVKELRKIDLTMCGHSPLAVSELAFTAADIITRLESVAAAARDLLEQIGSLSSVEFTKDIEPYKAEACWSDVLTRCAKALSHLPAASDGWKLVPVEPTVEMNTVGARSIGKTMGYPNHIDRAKECYQAMLSAAPNDKESG